MKDKQGRKQQGMLDMVMRAIKASFTTREHKRGAHAADGMPVTLSKDDWKTVLAGTKNALGDKNLSTLAASVAYYSTLAFFPFLAASVAVAALVITPEQLSALISASQAYLPSDISGVVATQLQNLVSQRTGNFLAASIALVVALFGASGASKSLVTASNVAYGVTESRGWLMQQLWGIIWTVFGLVLGAVILTLLAINQTVLGHLGIPDEISTPLLFMRWIIIIIFSISGLAVFYSYGPNRPRVRWRWASWGAIFATAAWLFATSLFFAYVQNIANYTQSYSLFAGIIMLMIWLNLSAVIVLVGAEINHQLELVGRKKWGGFLHRS